MSRMCQVEENTNLLYVYVSIREVRRLISISVIGGEQQHFNRAIITQTEMYVKVRTVVPDNQSAIIVFLQNSLFLS